MSKEDSGNPYHNSAFNRKEPAKQQGKHAEKGAPFVEEEIEREVDEIDEMEEELEEGGVDKRSYDELRDEVRGLESELKNARETLLRAHAEMENVRRRAALDVQGAHKYGNEKFIKELLAVVDSLEKALELGSEHAKTLHEGIELTHSLLIKALEKYGVKVLEPLNEPFDPNLHQAMSAQSAPDVKPNTVLMVFQKGYELNGRLIRPALVVVSS